MKRKLPIYKMTIDEDGDTAVSFVALVENPATKRNWFAFNSQEDEVKEHLKFKLDEERRIITGALMVADLPIYRKNKKQGEFYVQFDATEIEKAVQKFFRQGNTANVNMDHDPDRKTDGVYMYESFMVDSRRGIKAPEGFEGITEGSWIGTYKVDNQEVWDKIKSGEFQGFSVEGVFNMEVEESCIEDEIIKTIEEIEKL